MPQLKQKSPEQFVAQSPISEKLLEVFERNLVSGALRLVAVNGEPQDHRKLNNEKAKIQETLESGYFGIIQSMTTEYRLGNCRFDISKNICYTFSK